MAHREGGGRLRAALAVGSIAVAVALLAFMVVRESGGDEDGSDGEMPPPGRACTLIACGPGVRVQLARVPDAARSARVCVEGRCGGAQPLDRPGLLSAPLPRSARRDGESVEVVVRLLDGDGGRIARLSRRATVQRTRPNGPDCPPVCFQVRLRVDAERRG